MSDTTFSAFETKQASIQLQPYTFINSISIYCSHEAGVKFSVFDKGAKTLLFQTEYALDRVISSNLDLSLADPTYPFGPYFLTSPFIVLPPGTLQIQMTSLASSDNVIAQIMFGCAVPLTKQSINVNS